MGRSPRQHWGRLSSRTWGSRPGNRGRCWVPAQTGQPGGLQRVHAAIVWRPARMGAVGHPRAPTGTLSCPGSLWPQAAGLSGPRWPWQRSWLVCHILGGPRVGARSWRAMGGLNGQTYLKGLSEKIGSVCGGVGAGVGEEVPAWRPDIDPSPAPSWLGSLQSPHKSWREAARPRGTLAHPYRSPGFPPCLSSPPPLPAASCVTESRFSE